MDLDLDKVKTQVTTKLFTAKTLVEAGILRPNRPDHIVGAVRALLRFGPTPAGGYTASFERYADEIDNLTTMLSPITGLIDIATQL